MTCTIPWSLLTTVYCSRDEMEMDDQSLSVGDMPIRLLYPSFNKGQTSSQRDTASEKQDDIAK